MRVARNTNRYFGIFFLFILFSVVFYFTYQRLFTERMPNWEQVRTWHTDFFALCFRFALDYMRIRLRNICSAKLKWKESSRRIKYDCYFFCIGRGWLVLDFILDFPWLIFLVGVFLLPVTVVCIAFFKKNREIVTLATFVL